MDQKIPNPRRLGALEGGGTWIRLAVGTPEGEILRRERLRTRGPAETLGAVIDFFRSEPVSALGVGFFGPLSADRGSITATPKPGWSHAALRAPLSEALGIPVTVDTDVNAAALGEHWRGAGRGARSLLYLTVGTGIGGGILQDGRPIGGSIHPEVGHLAVPRQAGEVAGFEGVCPFHRDCLEGYASGPSLAARWGVPGERLPLGHAGWVLEARYLAAGLRAVVAVAGVDRVIVGGGVGGNEALWGPLRAALVGELGGYWGGVDVGEWLVGVGLGGDSALVGGLKMAANTIVS